MWMRAPSGQSGRSDGRVEDSVPVEEQWFRIPWRSVGIAAINVGLGGWLVAAPFVLAYNAGNDAVAATWNDIVVGVIVLVVAVVNAALGIRGPRDGRNAETT